MIQTMPSRLICATMFCLLWRPVKSRNLWIAMSLPLSTVCTSISARPFYPKISKPVVAYALGSVYLLCARTRGWSSYQSCLENPAPGFAKGWPKSSCLYICETFSGRTWLPTWTSVLTCQTTYRVKYLWAGMDTQRCIWGFRFGPPRAIQTTQLWRNLWRWQLLILAFDIDLFFVTILSWLTRKQHWNPNGAPFQCWLLLTWSGWLQESGVNPETKVGSST